MQPIKDVFPLLESPKKIFVVAHHKPDGDAVGSMLALYHYLTEKGHTVSAVTPSAVPEFLEWMPGVRELVNYEEYQEKALKALDESDIIFGLDFNDFSRTKHLTEALAEATQPKVLIDHHLRPAPVWDYGVSIPEKSSTSEMVYDFINLAGDNDLIDTDIAECIYTGVMTDTGSFRFPVTTGDTHRLVADLIDKGLKQSKIHEYVYDTWSVTRMHFVGYVLLEKMEIFPQYKAGLITLSKKDLKLFNISSGELEGLVNYPLSIANIRFATIITERGDEVKLSFRSKGDFDVRTFANKYFNGGGHFNASGGRSNMSFEETVTSFKQILSDIHPR
ncbi:MAG: bifunctional oligoribonuclease/PAP phosphatase NrnA [Chitinophagaceae bacterium]|nr:bifunctional oligoribonuclease/PAP phosphatase NrnA [Chitinophagaceae bacterium]